MGKKTGTFPWFPARPTNMSNHRNADDTMPYCLSFW